MRLRTFALLLALASAHCASGAPRVTKPAAVTAPSTKPPPMEPPTKPGVDPIAELRTRGEIQGEPVEIPYNGHRPKLVFLGRAGVAMAAWVAYPTASLPIEFPVGTRVRGVFETATEGAFVVVESVALLDQPAGRIGVVALGGGPSSLEVDAAFAFRNTTDVDSAKKAYASLVTSSTETSATARAAALESATKSLDTLRGSLASDGLDLFQLYQGVFLASRDHLDAKALKGERGARILARTKEAAAAGTCWGAYTCGPYVGSAVVLVFEGGVWKIRGLVSPWPFDFPTTKAKPTKAPKRMPRAIDSSSTTTASEAVLRRHVVRPGRVLGEAPLTDQGGTIGVAIDQDRKAPVLVIADGLYERVLPLYGYDLCFDASSEPNGYATRFVDADADGRTEVVVRAKDKSCSYGYTQLVYAPQTVTEKDASVDGRRELLVFRAKTLDDAVRSIVADESAYVTEKEACAVLAKSATAKGFLAHSSSDAVVLSFGEPGRPTLRAAVIERADLTDGDVSFAVSDCKQLSCDSDRCSIREEGPGSRHFWFRRTPKGIEIAGVAVYSGS